MKIFYYIIVLLLALIILPSSSLAQATPTDLEVVSIEFNSTNGHPSAIVVKNIGTTDFSGEIRSGVMLLNGSDQGLFQSVGSLDFGRDWYPDAFVNGRVPQALILPGQMYRVILSDIPGHRHRYAVKAEATIRPTDSSATNNKKIVTIPMPDFTTRITSVTKDATSDRNNYDRYTLKYDIINAGSVGYIGASSMSEPRHEININYQSGKKEIFGSDLSYRTFESIPAGGSIAKEKSIHVNKSETPKEIVIKVDTENNLSESNEGNNSIMHPFTGTNSTPPSTATTMVEAELAPIIIDGITEIDADSDVHPTIKDDSKFIGIKVKPCTALSGLKDAKDSVSSAFTFNKSKKAEKKLKQAASRAKSMSDDDGTLIDDLKCLAKQLAKYEDSQNDAVAIIEKLDKKDHDTAEGLSLIAIQSGISQAKTINWEMANSDTPAEIKVKIDASEKEFMANMGEFIKLVTDSQELKDTLNTSFDDNDSALSAILNLDLMKFFDDIATVAQTINEITIENTDEIKAALAQGDSTDDLDLKAFLDDIYSSENGGNGEIDLNEFMNSFEKDSRENSDNVDTEDNTVETRESNDSNTQTEDRSEDESSSTEPTNQNILPNQEDIRPNENDTQPSDEESAENGNSENSDQE